MKLKDKVKPAIPPMEGGVYMAVCVTVADLGDQYSEKFKNTQRKVVFSFDIPSETVEMDGETRPRQLSKRCTFSVSKRGTLNKMLNAWLNANMSEQDLAELDLFDFAGKACQIRVTVDKITFGRASADGLDDALKQACQMAVCAAAEELQTQDAGGVVASASNDGYSETYIAASQTPGQRLRASVGLWLDNTGLLYRGVCCPC